MLLTTCLARNESTNLQTTLPAWLDFSKALILDDRSTDNTVNLARDLGAIVEERRSSTTAWGNEAPARQELWRHAVERDPEWIFVQDADMLPLRNPKPLMMNGVDAVAFPLFDIWRIEGDQIFYRADELWNAHERPRIWAVKTPEASFAAEWPQRGIHCGHFPANLRPERVLRAPPEYGILHLAYANERLRTKKFAQYESKRDLLSERERLHATSILDASPRLKRLPYEPQWPIESLPAAASANNPKSSKAVLSC